MSADAIQLDAPPRGRSTILWVIGFVMLNNVLTIFAYVGSVGTDRLPQQAGRFVLTALLCLMLYRGHAWARWVTFVLVALATLAVVPSCMAALDAPIRASNGFLILMTFTYFFVARTLLWSEPAKAFLASQRERRRS